MPLESIAIIGMAGRYPNADHLGALWKNLITGQVSITDQVPDRLFRCDLHLRGAFVSPPPNFNENLWGEGPREINPDLALLLEVVGETLESSGYGSRRLATSNTGIWVARAKGHGESASLIASLLDCRGPALEIDSSCSSSLNAVHVAVQSLRTGETSMALVAAVQFSSGPEHLAELHRAGMLSPTGNCRPFVSGADGWVPGEGSGALLLKRHSDALRDGDHIAGLILGTAARHGGRAGRLTPVNLTAQVSLTLETLAQAGVSSDTISYVEANAVGDHLSDVVEFTALKKAFEVGKSHSICRIGSSKPNIGHLEAASGMAAIHKVLLCFQNLYIPPTLLAGPLNSSLPLQGCPLSLQSEALEWPRSQTPRRALVNAFAVTGVNAQLLLEEGPDPGAVARESRALSTNGRVSAPWCPEEANPLRRELHRLLSGARGAHVDDSGTRTFLEQGFDSVSILDATQRISRALGTDVPITLLFEHPTLPALVDHLRSSHCDACERFARDTTASSKDRVSSAGSIAPESWPLTPAQERFWLFAALYPDSRAHSCPMGVRLRGELEESTFREALLQLARAQPALSLRIYDTPDGPRQRLDGVHAKNLPFRRTDLRDLDPEQQQRRLEEIISRDLATPFDLSYECWRLLLLRLSDSESYVHLNIHHIVSDAASIGIFLRQLTAFWDGMQQAATPRHDLPPKKLAELMERPPLDVAAAQAFWLEYLASPPSTRLPSARRQSGNSHKGAVLRTIIPQSVATDLRATAAQAQCTLYAALLGAWVTLLHRYTGEQDVITASMCSGRWKPEQRELIGCFANTLPVRFVFRQDHSLGDVLTQVQRDTLTILQHRHFPLQEIVKKVALQRDAGLHPLGSTLIIFQNTMGDLGHLFGGLDAEIVEEEGLRATSEFDVFLQILEAAGELQLCFQYSTALFDQAEIHALAEAYRAILHAMTRSLQQSVDLVDILSLEDRANIERWNQTDFPYPRNSTLVDLFNEQVLKNPESLAVSAENGRMTYSELDRRARLIAAQLRRSQIRPQERVGICLSRTSNLMPALLGILKAGAAYVPLDPRHPLHRLESIARDANLRFIVTQPELEATTNIRSISGLELLTLHSEWYDSQQPDESPAAAIEGSHLAYVLYTSGSTGQPKGVEIAHESVVNLIYWAKAFFLVEHLRFVASSSSISFDSSVFELFAPICTGGCVILLESMLEIGRHPDANQVRLLVSGAPAAVERLAQDGAIPASVRAIILAGEPVSADLVHLLYSLPGVEKVFNLYGLTEATVYSTACLAERESKSPPAIGWPIANTRVFVLDRHLRLTPPGVAGEAFLGGDGLAKGFSGPGAAERLIEADVLGRRQRLYRTGDLVRQRRDGAIEFLTRLDFQVKLRGFRIELEEIESALRRNPSIESCIASCVKDRAGEPRLVAYYVAHGAPLQVELLRTQLRVSLPDYMLPAYFVKLARLPLNQNGKVDRGALPTPDWTRPEFQTSYSAPSECLEAGIATLWSELLGIDKIGVHDNFFDLGGHSLLIPRLRSRIESIFGVRLNSTDFFVYTTVASLAKFLTGTHAVCEAVSLGSPQTLPQQPAPSRRVQEQSRDLAVVAMTCRFPSASNPDEYWSNLLAARSAIHETGRTRWNWAEVSAQAGLDPQDESLRWTALLDDVQCFDYRYFQLSPREARSMDPQQRLLLELSAQLFEQVGWRRSSLTGRRIGVFLGASGSDYVQLLTRANQHHEAEVATGNSPAMLANRISYLLGLSGPSLVVDTACSSSLVAIHLARQSLLSSEADACVAGGVSLLLTPDQPILWAKSGILASNGRCHPFGRDSRGYVAGEGGGLILLKRLDQAQRDGDPIYAILKGTSTNHDGRSKLGLTAPSPERQKDVVLAALADAAVEASQIGLIEAHGTGTPLGDPVEIRGLTEAFRAQTSKRAFCAVSSAKGLLGHLGPASGVAAFIKAVQSLRHQKLAPHAGFDEPNPEICFEDSPFFVNDRPRDWLSETNLRMAGVSAFGFGGVNAHAILADAPAAFPAADTASLPVYVLTLSAMSVAALRSAVERHQAFLNKSDASLASICFTANTCRDPWKHRLAIVARSRDQLNDRLSLLLLSQQWNSLEASLIYSNQGEASESTLQRLRSALRNLPASATRLIRRMCGPAGLHRILPEEPPHDEGSGASLPLDLNAEQWAQLLSIVAWLFVHGEATDWEILYSDRPHRRVSLPVYSFDKLHCWVDESAAGPREVTAGLPATCEVRVPQWVEDTTLREPLPPLRHILVLAPGGEFASTLKHHLRDFAASVTLASVQEDYSGLLRDLGPESGIPDMIVYAGGAGYSFDEEPLHSAYVPRLASGLRNFHRLVTALPPLWLDRGLNLVIATSSTQPAEGNSDVTNPDQATLWGLASALRREHPRLSIRCIDLQASSTEAAGALAREIALRGPEEAALRRGRRLIQKWSPYVVAPSAPLIHRRATYLIWGATGGIGLRLANWLLENYDANLILVSRRLPAASQLGERESLLLAELRADPSRVLFETADIADPVAHRALLDRLHERYPRIDGIFQLAGIVRNQSVLSENERQLEETLRPKLHGTVLCDLLTRERPPGFLVLFSSLASVRGNLFQGAYSAANRFLDAFAAWRNGRGLRTVAINWPGWAGAGMARAQNAPEWEIPVDDCLAALLALLRGDLRQAAVFPAGLAPRENLPSASPLLPSRPNERVAADLESVVFETIAGHLQMPVKQLPRDRPLIELGLNSILAVQLSQVLGERLGVRLPRTILFEHSDLSALVQALSKIAVRLPAPAPEIAPEPAPSRPDNRQIAIVGLGGVLPSCPNLDEFWAILRAGTTVSKRSFSKDRPIDESFFHISRAEALAMDIQQKLLLEVAWQAVESANLGGGQLSRVRTGVFVGANSGTFQDVAPDGRIRPQTLLGQNLGILANRLSYFLDLDGPSITIDTLCASSLAAIHLAVQSLRSGECDVALVAAVRAGISDTYLEGAAMMGTLSRSGACRPFDSHADGIVLGEGAFAVVLKRLAEATANQDFLHGVIRGTAMGHTGRGSGLVVPNAAAQAKVIGRALADAGLPANAVQYVESHGTGTDLGDPIEVRGLAEAFQAEGSSYQFCAIGSVKANIGHLEAASGLAGLVKVLLAMKARQFPPAGYLREPNREIAFETTPFYLNDRLSNWQPDRRDQLRRAGVSSFGIGGLNANIVVEEARAASSAPRQHGDQILILSAHSEAVLREMAGAFAEKLVTTDADLTSICYSANTGRRRLAERVAVTGTAAEMVEALRACQSGKTAGGLWVGKGEHPPPLGFLFGGQGAPQGPAVEAFGDLGPFREALGRCSAIVNSKLGRAIEDILLRPDEQVSTLYLQPALFCFQYSLAESLRTLGIQPAFVAGHSVGELAAACTAGVLSLESALHLVCERARLMNQAGPGGGMASVRLSAGETAERMRPWNEDLSIAAHNGPQRTVVSGPVEALDAFLTLLSRQGVPVQRLSVKGAFHSRLMDQVLSPIEKLASDLPMLEPRVPFVSTVTGQVLSAFDSSYWSRQIRQPVLFSQAVRTLSELGCGLFLEINPSPMLSIFGPEILPEDGARWLFALGEHAPPRGFLDTLAQLHIRGFDPNWEAWWPEQSRRRLPLPATPLASASAVASNADSAPSGSPVVATAEPFTETSSQALLARVCGLLASQMDVVPAIVDPDRSLLELGADSLILSGALRALEREFGVAITMRQLMSVGPTARSLAQAVMAKCKPAMPSEQPSAPESRTFVPFQPYQREQEKEADARQEAFTRELIRRYAAKTQGSKEAVARHRRRHADSRASAGFRMSNKELLYPLVGSRGSGSRVWDVDGNEYIDITMGFGVHLFGHSPEFLRVAIQDCILGGIPLGPLSGFAGEVAEQLCSITGHERAVFCNSGTEANMLALRLARTATGRHRVVLFEGSYHGFYDGTLALAAGNDNGHSAPMAPGLLRFPAEDVIVLPYGDERALRILEKQIDQVAAVLVEPVQSRRPELQPGPFLQELRRITSQGGAALIFDEVITGLRCHPAGAQAWFNVRADLATYGKVLGGGMPVGCAAGSSRFLDCIDGGVWAYGDSSSPASETTFFAGTFCKHPLTMAAAKAVLSEVVRRGPLLQATLNQRTANLASELNTFLADQAVPVRIVHFSSLFRFAHGSNLDLLYYLLAEKGLFVWEGRNFFLSTAHTPADLETIRHAVQDSIGELQKGGLLPRRSSVAVMGGLTDQWPLTDAQRGIWVASSLGARHSVAYNEPLLIRLSGRLDMGHLHSAIHLLSDRHDVLRMRMIEQGMQRLVNSASVPVITMEDWASRTTDANLADAVATWARERSTTPFTLDNAPSLEVGILRIADQEHFLLLTAHHSMVDGPSLDCIAEDLGSLYAAHVKGVPLPAAPKTGWCDYLAWEQAEGSRIAAAHCSYWLQVFQTGVPGLDLPYDYPRPATLTADGGRVRFELSADATASFQRLAANSGATLFVSLLAAFKVLLMRWSGQEDLVVGIPTSIRDSRFDRVAGQFVRMLPIRTRATASSTFAEYMQEVRERVAGALDFAGVSLQQLTAELKISRDASRFPLFSVEFNMDPVHTNPARQETIFPGLASHTYSLTAPMENLDLAVIGGGSAELDCGTSKFDLTLSMARRQDGYLAGVFEYNSSLFDRHTVLTLGRAFVGLVEGLVHEPGTPLKKLSLLDSQSREFLNRFNQTARAYPLHRTFPDLLEQQAHAAPQDPAIYHGDDCLSYLEWSEGAKQLASTLDQLEPDAPRVVALLAERGIPFAIAAVGIQRAGHAYLPLDPSHPPHRLADLLQTSRATVVVHTDVTARLLEAVFECLDGKRPANLQVGRTLQGRSRDLPLPGVTQVAYVIYTSGSTGTPKGAQVEQQGMLNHLFAKVEDLSLCSSDIIAQNASQCFDISVWQFFAGSLVGAKVVIFDDETSHDAGRMLELVMARGVTVLEVVPSQHTKMLALLEAMNSLPQLNLRWLILTGEQLPAELCQRWLKLYPSIPILNGYGPTECSDDVCHHVIREPLPPTYVAAPIGFPIANMRTYVVDRFGQRVPPGWRGELCVGGIGVGPGYLHDLDRTRQSFHTEDAVENANALPQSVSHRRLYQTGDLVRVLPDGALEFLGRSDSQLKIRGYRIQPEEIEAAIRTHGGVEQVAVAPFQIAGETRLAAYLVPRVDGRFHWRSEMITAWGTVFDSAFAAEAASEDGLARSHVWVSSRSRQQVPSEEVDDCVAEAVRRILTLGGHRLFEIGCGNGAIQTRLASQHEIYVGTDISKVALRHAEQRAGRTQGSQVSFLLREATDFRDLANGSFDTLVLNEVVQYFPDLDYLLEVLDAGLRVVEPGGHVFLGGVRNLLLLPAFQMSLAIPDADSGPLPESLHHQVEAACRDERELVIAPSFFSGLTQKFSRIRHVEILPRVGRFQNEFTRFRYDVILHLDAEGEPAPVRWLSQKVLERELLREALHTGNSCLIGAQGVANSRVTRFVNAWESGPADTTLNALDPADLERLAAELGTRCRISWSATDSSGKFDIVFGPGASELSVPFSFPAAPATQPASTDPLRVEVEARLAAALRSSLEDRLPYYMVPSRYIVLDHLPLNANGKIDRRALPPPPIRPRKDTAGRPPGALEFKLTRIWEAILGETGVRLDDNFFDLGGDSLKAVSVVSRIREHVFRKMEMAILFRNPTVAQLAEAIRRDGGSISPLMELCVSSSPNTLYCVHPVGGSALCYRDLANRLAPDWHVYGLQARGFHGEQAIDDLPALAAYYVAEIRAHQSEGPYRLLGWSVGGVIVYEMARQLANASANVVFVGMLDAEPADDADPQPEAMLQEFLDQNGLRGFVNMGEPARVRGLSALPSGSLERNLRYLAELRGDLDKAYLQHAFSVFSANWRAHENYKPGSYNDRVDLFACGPSLPRAEVVWQPFAASLHVHPVPGTHNTILDSEHLNDLVPVVRSALAITVPQTHSAGQ